MFRGTPIESNRLIVKENAISLKSKMRTSNSLELTGSGKVGSLINKV